MRLVDADKQLEWVDCVTPIHGIGLEPVVAVETVRDLIKGAPTIDAIPVEWLREKIKEHTDEEGWQDYLANSFGLCIEEWQKEQEAKT